MGAQSPVMNRMIADLESHLLDGSDLVPGQIPVFAGLEPHPFGDVERGVESVLLEQRGHEIRMTQASVVKGEHDGLVRHGLLDDAVGILRERRRRDDQRHADQEAGQPRHDRCLHFR